MKAANSQGLTVEQAAKLMNVSTRSVYDAMRLRRTGREDLIARVEAGELTLHRALILAGVKRERSRLDAMKAAWAGASEGDRAAFLQWVLAQYEGC